MRRPQVPYNVQNSHGEYVSQPVVSCPLTNRFVCFSCVFCVRSVLGGSYQLKHVRQGKVNVTIVEIRSRMFRANGGLVTDDVDVLKTLLNEKLL